MTETPAIATTAPGTTTLESAAEFTLPAEPTSTSAMAISTALVDDAVLASATHNEPQPEGVADVVPLADVTAPLPEAEPEAKSAAAPANDAETAPAAAAEPAAEITEPAAEAAAAPDTTPPRRSQAAPASGPFPSQSHKDFIMDMTTNFGSGLNDVMSGAQDKAKEAFEKGSSMMGEAGSFARGNVEAVVESGKILAAGLQDMGTNLVAESRSSFETMTADLKELAASKTPADFFKAQSEIMRKSMDSMVGFGSKNSEAMLKLASDVFAPLSGRMNMAVEKVKMPMA